MEFLRNISGNFFGHNATLNQSNISITVNKASLDDKKKFLKSISKTNPAYDKKRIQMDKGPLLRESFSWVLDHENFNRWCSTDSGVFWIKGDPGKGKTMLICGIINEFEKDAAISSNLSYFFCQATDSTYNTATAVIGGLLVPLLRRHQVLLSEIQIKYEDQLEGPNAFIVLCEIFETVIQHPKFAKSVFIIDAIDECIEGCNTLLRFIIQTNGVKWLISSRNEKAIERELRSIQPRQILSLEHNAEFTSNAIDICINNRGQNIPALESNEELRMKMLNPLAMDTYTVGWICALPAEFAAGRAMLDLQHPQLSQNKHDPNSYAFGCIGNHNVVIACLPYGVHNGGWAAGVLNNIRRSFKSLRFCLMVGIGGAVPCTPSDIRLGDIFVSNPAMNSGGGVIQYDSGKLEQHGIFMQTGLLNAPPISLLAAVSAIQANHEMSNPTFPDHLEAMFKTYKRMEKKYSRPPPETDILFNSNYDHPKNSQNCSQCDQDQRKSRSARDSETVVHYGLIASGNGVMKYGTTRDKIWKQYGIECFEMEAAGLMNNFQCLVIRGISDYADSHKNDIWKPYAAAIAAAYTKELLLIIPTEQIKAMPAKYE